MKKVMFLATIFAMQITLFDCDLFGQCRISASPTSGPAPLTVQFTALVNLPGSITSIFWSFGDGGTSSELNPIHTYTNAGTYTVRFEVTSTFGNCRVLSFNYINVTSATPRITVTAPNGGEHWQIGSTQSIRWTSSNLSGNVKIEVSRDGGSTYSLIESSTSNDGAQPWVVTGPAATRARIRISSVNNSAVNDVSNSDYIINDGLPAISISRDRLDFGEIAVNNSKEESFTVDNTGTADLIVNNIARTSGSSEFSMASPTSFPITIRSSDPPVAVTVRFTPSSEGRKNATLTISSNDLQKPTVTVALSGTGKAQKPLNPPRNLTADGLPGKVALSWLAPVTAKPDTIEISYDDGMAETGLRGNFAGAELAVRFTPASYPVTLIGMSFLAVGNANNDRYGVKVYLDPTAANRGPSGSPVFSGALGFNTPGTIGANFPKPITVNSGDFYIALNYISGTTRDFSIGLDKSSDVRRSWLSSGPGRFALTRDLGFPGNLIIRAMVVSSASARNTLAVSRFSTDEKQDQTDALNDRQSGFQVIQRLNETSNVPFEGLDYSLTKSEPSLYLMSGYSLSGHSISPNAKLQGYNIYRSTSSPVQIMAQNKIGHVDSNTTKFDDTDVIGGTKYFYVVTAAYNEGESGPSNEESATPRLDAPLRLIRVANASASPGSTVSIPIELIAQGDENKLGFSLTFDPLILGNPRARLGRNAGSAVLDTNSGQQEQGRYGIALSLPGGQTFAAHTLEIIVMTFAVNPNTSADSARINFGNQPIAQEVMDVNANTLSTTWTPGVVTIEGQTSVKSNTDEVPLSFELGQNYPNPFNPSTTIAFAVPHASRVTLKVFNLVGAEVTTLVDEQLAAGQHKAHWNASGMESGVYFYQLRAGEFVATKKLILMK